tara:strand:+ start:15687 stop:16232 length:546 start_codon:yes stop_codon:yes gene_type:complete
MNTHHNIHLIKTKTDLKVTYRDGRFLQIKKLRGTLNAEMIKYIGYVIPPEEKDLDAFIQANKAKVIYTSEKKAPVTLYSQFNTTWFAFFRKQNNNIPPKFTAADGNALKQIISYLKEINGGNETAALANWNLLLNSWDSLSDFHQAQTDLKYINSKLNVIIREIIRKNGNNTSGDNSSVSI